MSKLSEKFQIFILKNNFHLYTALTKTGEKKMTFGIYFDRHNYSNLDPTENAKAAAFCCSLTLLVSSIGLLAFSRLKFDCETCPSTGFLTVGIVITCLSFIAICTTVIDCYREGVKQRGEQIFTTVCLCFVAFSLGITGTILGSRVCHDLKC